MSAVVAAPPLPALVVGQVSHAAWNAGAPLLPPRPLPVAGRPRRHAAAALADPAAGPFRRSRPSRRWAARRRRSGATSTGSWRPAAFAPSQATECSCSRTRAILGYVFDPLTVFWVLAPEGTVRAVVFEVHNTFGQRHAYLLHVDDSGRAEVDKAFYVSPFNDTSGSYAIAPAPDAGAGQRHGRPRPRGPARHDGHDHRHAPSRDHGHRRRHGVTPSGR